MPSTPVGQSGESVAFHGLAAVAMVLDAQFARHFVDDAKKQLHFAPVWVLPSK